MIRHSVKLLWRRKGPNALLILEIAVSFLVVFAVCLGALTAWANARHPIGFDRENLWAVAISVGGTEPGRVSVKSSTGPGGELVDGDVSRRLLRETQALPEVASAALIENAPYEMSESESRMTIAGKVVSTETLIASDELAETLDLDLVEGRFFERSDEAAHWVPRVVNARLARELFGDESAVGRSLGEGDDGREQRIVGVVRNLRRKGELARPGNLLLIRQPGDEARTLPLRNLLVRVEPGVPRAWERELVERLEGLAIGVSVRVRSVEELRAIRHQFTLVPLLVGSGLATFMLLMVVLGLLGVLWQDVTRRRSELGLRRALGADASAIHRQVMGELLVLVAAGLLGGGLVIAQLPLFGIDEAVGVGVFLVAIALAAVLTAGLAALAGVRPSRLATRIQPAAALHHE